MSIRLMVEMLDHAPAELTPAERLLLVAIAEKADEQTRMSWPGMDTLTQRTGLSDRQVRRMLADLAARGYEVRVQCGVDRHGMPVFATKGHRTVYRVPAFRQRGSRASALKEDACDRLNDPKADIPGTQRRTYPVAKADACVPPSFDEPSKHPSNQRARAGDEIAAVIEALRKRTGKIIDPNFAKLVIKNVLGDGERPDIGNRVAYLVAAIRDDPDPVTRFLPIMQPPPPHEVLGIDAPEPTQERTDPGMTAQRPPPATSHRSKLEGFVDRAGLKAADPATTTASQRSDQETSHK